MKVVVSSPTCCPFTVRILKGEGLHLGRILIPFLLCEVPLQSLGLLGGGPGAGFSGEKKKYTKLFYFVGEKKKKLDQFQPANFQKQRRLRVNYSTFLLTSSASKIHRCLTHFIHLSVVRTGRKFENNIIVSMINEKAKYC